MTSRSLRGRGDLARILAVADPPDRDRLALMLDYERADSSGPVDRTPEAPTLGTPVLHEMPISKRPLVDVPFYYAARFTPRESPTSSEREPVTSTPVTYAGWRERPETPPPHPALAPWRLLEPQLRACLAPAAPAREIDTGLAVARLARAELLERFPGRQRRRWARRLHVVWDRSPHLVPYWLDQEVLTGALRRLLPYSEIETVVFDATSGTFRLADHLGQPRTDLESVAEPLLVLGDLGLLGSRPELDRERWLNLGARLGRGQAIVLSPADASLFPADLRHGWTILRWDGAPVGPAASLDEQHALARRLLRLVSPAVRLEPGLLRALRKQLLPEAPASVEALAWQSPAILHGSAVAATLDPEPRKALRAAFEGEPEALRAAVLELVRVWHAEQHEGVWFEELLDLPAGSQRLVPAADVADARAYFQSLCQQRQAGGDDAIGQNVRAWLGRVGARTEAAWQDAAFREVVWSIKRHDPSFMPPVEPGVLPLGTPIGQIAVGQRGNRLAFEVGITSDGSLLGLCASDDGLVEIVADEDWRALWGGISPPAWVSDYGTDRYGNWLEIELKGVTQRMRWIPPGRFMMGSPPDEESRLDWEGPRHEVTFTEGFWLFATPVTQALYAAVTGENPSRFRSQDRPVESVSWHDADTFLKQLNTRLPGLSLVLPSEAQWEYACRAGTTTPFSFGEEVSRKQVHFAARGTVPVAWLPPNQWGLFEMHGNVHEWCEDHWHWQQGYEGAPTDGSAWLGEPESANARRVLRGGSWAGAHQEYWTSKPVPDSQKLTHCRSASRSGARSEGRNESIGFRPARGPVVRDAATGGRRVVGARVTLSGRANPAPLPAGPFILRSDRAELAIARVTRTDIGWARAIGRDRFGLWSDLVLDDVRQRLRWIPPGRFLMGAPEDEPRSWNSERPRHPVTIVEGFWLFDTPVTQALWMAVMGGDNPSRFQTPDRPVEQVSWAEVRGFLERINGRFSDLDLVPPSEAQWEYACRAGTETAVWTGPLKILGERNAPGLEPIAWYGGNSGHGFELDDGWDSSDWKEKQYPHRRAGTRPVGLKAANPWGLHDMLGNVWEWCADDWHDSYNDAPSDGCAWLAGGFKYGKPDRVIRGGSWDDPARRVSAACRRRYRQGGQVGHLGFRCARGQV